MAKPASFADPLLSDYPTIRSLQPFLLCLLVAMVYVVSIGVIRSKAPYAIFIPGGTAVCGILVFIAGFAVAARLCYGYNKRREAGEMYKRLLNTSRNLAMSLHAFIPREQRKARRFFAVMIPDFAYSLLPYCNEGLPWEALADTDEKFIPELKKAKHVPNKMVYMMVERVHQLNRAGALKDEHVAILCNDLHALTALTGAIELQRRQGFYQFSAWSRVSIAGVLLLLPLCLNIPGLLLVPLMMLVSVMLIGGEFLAGNWERYFFDHPEELKALAEEVKDNIQ